MRGCTAASRRITCGHWGDTDLSQEWEQVFLKLQVFENMTPDEVDRSMTGLWKLVCVIFASHSVAECPSDRPTFHRCCDFSRELFVCEREIQCELEANASATFSGQTINKSQEVGSCMGLMIHCRTVVSGWAAETSSWVERLRTRQLCYCTCRLFKDRKQPFFLWPCDSFC